MHAIIFGRFRIIHAGHLSIIEDAISRYGTVTVAVSSSSANQRSVALLQHHFAGRANIVVASNPFTLLGSLIGYQAEELVFIAGADRHDMLNRLQRYYPTVQVELIERQENACSSTACRRLLANSLSANQLISAGLAIDTQHAYQIIAQYTLEGCFNEN